MSEKKVLQTLEEGIMLTGLVAGIGWVGQKAMGESLSPNPSKSAMSFVKMAATVTGSMFLKDWLKKEKYWPDILMATIAVMVGGAVLNATAFVGGGYLANYLAGDDHAAVLAERARHDRALEDYQREMGAWQKKRTAYKDWLEKHYQEKMAADKNFENTDYAFKLYAQTHPNGRSPSWVESYLRQKPVFRYVPSERHKNNELLYVGLGGLALGAAVAYFI